MIALLANLGQMFLILFGSNFQRLAEVFDLHEKIGMTIAAIGEAFECFEADVSDDVSHHGYKFVFSCVANLGRIP